MAKAYVRQQAPIYAGELGARIARLIDGLRLVCRAKFATCNLLSG